MQSSVISSAGAAQSVTAWHILSVATGELFSPLSNRITCLHERGSEGEGERGGGGVGQGEQSKKAYSTHHPTPVDDQ